MGDGGSGRGRPAVTAAAAAPALGSDGDGVVGGGGGGSGGGDLPASSSSIGSVLAHPPALVRSPLLATAEDDGIAEAVAAREALLAELTRVQTALAPHAQAAGEGEGGADRPSSGLPPLIDRLYAAFPYAPADGVGGPIGGGDGGGGGGAADGGGMNGGGGTGAASAADRDAHVARELQDLLSLCTHIVRTGEHLFERTIGARRVASNADAHFLRTQQHAKATSGLAGGAAGGGGSGGGSSMGGGEGGGGGGGDGVDALSPPPASPRAQSGCRVWYLVPPFLGGGQSAGEGLLPPRSCPAPPPRHAGVSPFLPSRRRLRPPARVLDGPLSAAPPPRARAPP